MIRAIPLAAAAALTLAAPAAAEPKPQVVTAWAEIVGCKTAALKDEMNAAAIGGHYRDFQRAMIDNMKGDGEIACKSYARGEKLDVLIAFDRDFCVVDHDPVKRYGRREAMCYWIPKGTTVEVAGRYFDDIDAVKRREAAADR